MSNVLDLFDQTFFASSGRPESPACCSASGCTTARSTSTVCASSITICSGGGYPAASNAHPCRSAAIAGSRPAVSPTSRSSRRLARAKNSTPGSASRPTPPLDAEHGPGWHLAVLPFTDGGAGVSLVISHCLTDGVGLCEALADAASGRHDPINWPAAGSRRRWQALREDARQTARDIPGIGRAVVAAAARQHDSRGVTAAAPDPPPRHLRCPPEPTNPSLSQRQRSSSTPTSGTPAHTHLGGTSNTLLAGVAARLAQRVGRVTADGSVTLAIPVNERTADDTRANAVANVDITVDPAPATTDLREIRAATKQALIRRQEVPDERWALLPLVPLLPQRLVRRMVGVAAGGATSVVSSNLGVVNPAANRPDGTDADHFAMRSPYPGVTKAIMHRIGGMLALLSGRVQTDRSSSRSVAYQPGRPNSNDDLRTGPFERSERLLAHRHDRLAMP